MTESEDPFIMVLGIIICLAGSFFTAVSNTILKYYDFITDEMEAKGEPDPPCCNFYCTARYVTLILGASGDLVSMGMLPFGLWAGLNVSNLIFYMILAQMFLGDPLEGPELAVLLLITASVVGTALWGPQPVDKDGSAFDDALDTNPYLFLVALPATMIVFATAFYFQRKTLAEIKGNPQKDPPGYMPNPASTYNVSGPVCAGILTAFAQVAIKCAVGSIDPIEWTIIFPVLGIIAFYPFHLMNLNFMAEELHAVTCTPAHILITSLFNALWGYVLFDSEPKYPYIYIASLQGILASVVIYVFVEDYLYRRESNSMEAILLTENKGRAPEYNAKRPRQSRRVRPPMRRHGSTLYL